MKKIILSAALSIVMCLSLIAGATFALFTSETAINVAVTAGNVELVATVENISYTSTLNELVPESKAEFTPASDANPENIISLEYVVPGDVVTFDIRVQNLSDVTVSYRTAIKMVSDTGLWDGLVVTIDNVTYDGTDITADWATLAPNSQDIIVSVSITLPEAAGNEFMKTSCKLAYTVEAIQGNVDTTTLQ